MKKLLKLFCGETSIHGMSYLVDTRIQLLRFRAFWMFALVLSCCGCVSLVWKVVEIIREDPIVTFTSDVTVHVRDVCKSFNPALKPVSFVVFQIPFVGVAICPEVEVNSTVTGNYYSDWRTSLENNERSIDNFTEPE
jgi:hypothetical protein